MSVVVNQTGPDSYETVWMFVIPSSTAGNYEVTALADWGFTNYAFAVYEFPAGTYATDVGSALDTTTMSDTLTLWGGGYTPIDDYYIYGYASGNSQIGSTTVAHLDADSERDGGASVGHDSAYTATITGDDDLVMGGIGVRRTDSGFVAPTITAGHFEGPDVPATPVNFDFAIHNSGSFVIVVAAIGYYGAPSITIGSSGVVPEVRELTIKMKDHSFKPKTTDKDVKFHMSSNPT
jgi:hypothetical protein